jgi:hypothetical protein
MGSYPQLYSFSDRRMATRFVSCTHLVGAYANRPREVKDRAESVIEGSWEMFRADWEAHPPVLIIDMSTAGLDWATHPMTRYPVLGAYLNEYRVESVINGATIYRRLNSGRETARCYEAASDSSRCRRNRRRRNGRWAGGKSVSRKPSACGGLITRTPAARC